MIDKSIRQHYVTQDSKRRRFLHGAMGASATPGATSGGGGGGRDPMPVYSAPAPRVTTAVAPPSILSRPDPVVTTAPITRDVIPVAPTITKRPTEMLDIAGDIKAQEKLQEDIRESQRTGAYAKELGLPSIKRDVIPPPIINPFEETEEAGKLVDLTDLGDDAKTQQVRIIQKKADLSWQNKSTYEKEEQQEKWDAAESKIKLQKEGGFWKSLGNIAMAMIVPALLPAKLATAYKLANVAKTATAFAKKIGLTDQDAVQYVKNNILGGKDLSSLVAGKENVIAKSISQFTGQGDDLSDIKEHRADVSQSDIDVLGKYNPKQDVDTIRMIEKLNPTITDQEIKDVLQKKITSPTGKFAAHGGRIDKPLMGRNRYI